MIAPYEEGKDGEAPHDMPPDTPHDTPHERDVPPPLSPPFSNTYICHGGDIHAHSLARIRACTPTLAHLTPPWARLVSRLIQACAMEDIIHHLSWHEAFIDKARHALQQGCRLFTDSHMVASGINRTLLQKSASNDPSARIISLIQTEALYEDARKKQMTRSAALVDRWAQHYGWAQQLIVIGNAPTCLFRLIDYLRDAPPSTYPAAVIAFPVGFVGAVRAKRLFVETWGDTIPYITLQDKRGGSALAVATLHALLDTTARDKTARDKTARDKT